MNMDVRRHATHMTKGTIIIIIIIIIINDNNNIEKQNKYLAHMQTHRHRTDVETT